MAVKDAGQDVIRTLALEDEIGRLREAVTLSYAEICLLIGVVAALNEDGALDSLVADAYTARGKVYDLMFPPRPEGGDA